MKLTPKKWDEFQHYKDRSPPWIKLHRDLLNNREYLCLPIASKALAPFLWLLASESKNAVFDASIEELEFRLRFSRKEIEDGLKPLIDKGFFAIASGVLAPCLQVAIPETERETEKRHSKKKEICDKPDSVSQEVWDAFVKHRSRKKADVSELIIKRIAKEAQEAGWELEAALEETVVRNWQSFKAEYVAKKKTFVDQKAEKDLSAYERMMGRA